jgi:ribonucleotide reductase beta subunit family protein with ferritin-like domain
MSDNDNNDYMRALKIQEQIARDVTQERFENLFQQVQSAADAFEKAKAYTELISVLVSHVGLVAVHHGIVTANVLLDRAEQILEIYGDRLGLPAGFDDKLVSIIVDVDNGEIVTEFTDSAVTSAYLKWQNDIKNLRGLIGELASGP